jgi:hypothetical protein
MRTNRKHGHQEERQTRIVPGSKAFTSMTCARLVAAIINVGARVLLLTALLE